MASERAIHVTLLLLIVSFYSSSILFIPSPEQCAGRHAEASQMDDERPLAVEPYAQEAAPRAVEPEIPRSIPDVAAWQTVEPSAVGRDPFVTFFTVPRSMYGTAAQRQKVAITSWSLLQPAPRIMLMGNDPGVAEFAAEIGAVHVGDIETSDRGTPRLDSCFRLAHERSGSEVLIFINTDIVLFDGFIDVVRAVYDHYSPNPEFFMSGRRTTVHVNADEIELSDTNWRDKLLAQTLDPDISNQDTLDAIDYFIFNRGLLYTIPPFLIGRYSWDSWIMNSLAERLVDTVDASESITIAHIFHDVHNKMLTTGNVEEDDEVKVNRALAHGNTSFGNLQYMWDKAVPCDVVRDRDCHATGYKVKHKRWRPKDGGKFFHGIGEA